MQTRNAPPLPLAPLFCFVAMHPALLLLLLLPHASVLHVAAASNQTNDTRCTPARCGNLSITYPFSLGGVQPLYCGYPAFELTCDDAGSAYLSRTFREHLYLVRDISYDNNSLVVSVEDTFAVAGNMSCPLFDFNVSSSLALFPLSISDTNEDLVFVNNCTLPRKYKPYELSCDTHKMEAFIIHQQGGESNLTDVPKNCSFLSTVPVRRGGIASEYKKLISDGFLLEWETLGDCSACNHSGGECRFDEGSFRCFCPYGSPCSSRDRENPGIKIGAGIATAVLCLTILSICCILLYNRRKRKQSASLDRLIREGTPLASLRKEFSLADSPGTHIFTYEELDEATDGFSDARELGVGGFGIVYKGTLRDGSVVAVKRLYKNSYKGKEQFQNEVDLRQLRLRHPNLVTLYGCTSQSSCRDLLLVYEFVPNGTLADHLHGARAAAQPLAWPTRLSIAIETASALDYLHSLEPQVVHRDVKTNNILLDEGFHVKVADFGLSRLFPLDATHVSTAPQGTPGYVDPMYHQCYQLTDKSDVYSFGVVLVELISSKPAVDMNRNGGDVNLANMAVHMIQCYEIDQLVDPRLRYQSDCETKRTVDLVAEVAFRCLQPEQDVRPPIREVLDVLREAQKMKKVGCVKDDMGLLKKSRDGSPDTVMYQWMSPSTTTTSNHSS